MSQNKSKATFIWESWGKIVLLIAGALILSGVTLAITDAFDIYKGNFVFACFVFVAYILVLLMVNVLIRKIKTPSNKTSHPVTTGDISPEQLMTIIKLLGGQDNILGVESCLTRLRVKIKDTDDVDTSNAWKESGAQGVIIKDDSVQAIFGEKTELLKLELKKELNL